MPVRRLKAPLMQVWAGSAWDAEATWEFCFRLALAAKSYQWLRLEGEHPHQTRGVAMDEDDDPSPGWDEDEARGRRPSGRPGSDALLIPLARSQDAVARLEASGAAAADRMDLFIRSIGLPSSKPSSVLPGGRRASARWR